MKIFTCKMCGKEFESEANHAYYCTDCRAERQRDRSRAYNAKKKNNEKTNNIGSSAICEKCGKEYVRAGGNQRVCENCRLSVRKKNNQKPHDEYVSRNYDVIKVYVKKGERDRIKQMAAEFNVSVNELVNYGIDLAIHEFIEYYGTKPSKTDEKET